MATETLPQAIQDELDRLDAYRQKVVELAPVLEVAQAVAAATQQQTRVRFLQHSGKPLVLLEVWIDSLRDALPVLNKFARRGFRRPIVNEELEYCDCAETNTRMYRLCAEGEQWDENRLDMHAILTGRGSCRRVQVGTAPVYELVCD